MDLNPPEGSKISVASGLDGPTIVIPQATGAMRYGVGLFLLFWLGGWVAGFRSAATKLWTGPFEPFVAFWLAAWTVGGAFAALMLYRAFRPTVPETLKLGRRSIVYDSGVTAPQFNNYQRNRSTMDAWRSMFPRRVRAEFNRSQLQSLRLRETDTGNRLTLDNGSERIEIASTASEVDREWLSRLLEQRYALSQPSAGVHSAGDGVDVSSPAPS